MKINFLFKKLLYFPYYLFCEILTWVEYFISTLPGLVGKILRIVWYSVKMCKLFRLNVSTGCFFSNIHNMQFGQNIGIARNCSFYSENGRIEIGDNTAFNENCHINSSGGGLIKIGKKCMIGPNVVMRTASHNFSNKNIFIQDQSHSFKNIIISENCWIAANVTILGGVTIGTGSVIGAGAVVTKSIPEFSVAVGVPAKVIKKR
jgi:acetyltransferase-like isoleucine patch superfamily enzyme